LKLF
jgi:hypothetical protein